MAKDIEQITLKSGLSLTIGHFGLGLTGQGPGSPKREVHDGDTAIVHGPGNMSVRLLGVDAPEVSYRLPGAKPTSFTPISDPKWETFLSDPLTNKAVGAKLKAFSAGLLAYLETRWGKGTAMNHDKHAAAATKEFIRQVEADRERLGQTDAAFRYFLAFAYEILDRFGRLLAYINVEQKAKPRPLDYNGRLLKAGLVTPYFIWPNIDPFLTKPDIMGAVIDPFTAKTEAAKAGKLKDAQQAVRAARQNKIGLYEKADPLRLLPFELRFLAEGRPPARWVIDLSKNDDQLIPPTEYFTIPNPEDRLFVAEDRIPLFVAKGWKRG
jgi:endonuclease YncB( thermonuclease family)